MHRTDANLSRFQDVHSARSVLKRFAAFGIRHAAQDHAARPLLGRKGAQCRVLASEDLAKTRVGNKDPTDVHFWTADDMPSQVRDR